MYIKNIHLNFRSIRWTLRCVVANELDCDIEVSEFLLQSGYYFHFRFDTTDFW